MDKYKRNNCRYCDAELPIPFLELGPMALANSFLTKEELSHDEFVCPLDLTRCENCGLIQLTHVVPADLMFSNYLYVSSTTATFREHFAAYAANMSKRCHQKVNAVAVDIGSNDGLLVSEYIKCGMNAVGVEPATNLAVPANDRGVPTINRYFGEDTVEEIISRFGKADVISANNVFAHIDDSHSVCNNVYNLLSDSGMFVIEFPYLVTMVEQMLFDMIYHEHLSYIAVTPLSKLMATHGLEIFDIEYVQSHGGSLRVFIQKKDGPYAIEKTVSEMMENEETHGYNTSSIYNDFAQRVYNVKKVLNDFVNDKLAEGNMICGYGAPAKANTIINFCKLTDKQISYIVDDNPLKQNMYSPGAHIPVVASIALSEHQPDYLIIFAWNFATEIIKKMGFLKERGVNFIIPLPEPILV